MSAVASLFLMVNIWAAGRGKYRWQVDGIATAVILFILWVILWPTTLIPQSPPAADASFQRRNLRGATLSSYNFAGANLQHADLSSADLDHGSFRSANLIGANLATADLSHAWLLHASAAGANLTRANLEHAILSAANLRRARLHNADLRNARLNDMGDRVSHMLRGAADLRNADLTGADLRGTSLQGANLTGARYDARTRWTVGFHPVKHGATFTKPPIAAHSAIPM